MRLAVWIASLWPGLPQAWRLGSVRGLALAMLFAAGLNLALVCSFVWPRWPIAILPPGTAAAIAWVWVLGLWIIGFRWTAGTWRNLCPLRRIAEPQIDEWFREAQQAYLQGHWIEAEGLLAKLLAREPDDAETRLLLASVQRRTQSWDQSRRTLNELREQPAAARWRLEIDTELKHLDALEAETAKEAEETSHRHAA